jgi:hypothetical protein
MTCDIFLPSLSIHFVSLPPFDEMAILIPIDMMVEGLSGKLPACLKTSTVHVSVIVGDIEVSVVDRAINKDQIVRFVAG